MATIVAQAQYRAPALAMNERLGRGINMGNAFEAPTETAWGNQWDPAYFKIMADLGFDHVRLPVRWEPSDRSIDTAPYTIHPGFLDRIREVVDTALKYKLHIIVNMHHHEALYEDPDGQKERFLRQWSQIATHFRDYPDSLLFEVLNEPHGNLTPAMWNTFFAEALAEIRKTNPTRVVLQGVADYGGLGGLARLEVPSDDYIIVTPHYYNPFTFTHQGAGWVGEHADAWIGTQWRDTEAEREAVLRDIAYAIRFSQENHVPVHVGEFGAYEKADLDSRVRWTTFLSRWFEGQGFSWAYWEFSAGFGIYNPATRELLTPLSDALLHDEIPEPTPVYPTARYESDFSTGADGWFLQTQSGASGHLTVSGGKLHAAITSAGSENWHVQLVRNNLALERGKMYRISYTASSDPERTTTFYAGKASDPWIAYSGYSGINLSSEPTNYSQTFTMNEPTDPASRLVFDLGKSSHDVWISDVVVEQLSFVITSTDLQSHSAALSFFPNPVIDALHIDAGVPCNTVEILDVHGRTLIALNPIAPQTSVYMGHIPAGVYLVRVSSDRWQKVFRILKE